MGQAHGISDLGQELVCSNQRETPWGKPMAFRRQQNLELIIPQGNKWKKVRRGLKKYIDEIELPEIDNSKRQLIKDKLSELNRVSFDKAFARFCDHYSVRLEDLWPVTSKERGVSLSQIRN